ncbi:MAG: GNAT family N-acetyltransferase [Acholeplasmataceae bacterium]|nr:GNAT family N-acetyltransferase [Acholeplasmataceae bacterium]
MAAVSIEGSFISHCGTWYQEGTACVLLEPVATIPTYRKQSFGKACIYEALNRAREKGAKVLVVGSSEILYQKLGFTHLITSHYFR